MVTRITDLRTQGDYKSLDDRMLVLDFQAGQPEAFVEIHRRYSQLARHICQRFLPNRADADEAFQETMIRVYQGLHRFNGQYALQPWIGRIATNVSLDQIRTRSRRPLVDDGALDEHERRDPAEGPEEVIERLIERDLVLSVLSGLPPSHRTALVLRELEGRSHKEIAERLDITPAQAKALIHRAKMSFRRGWLIAVTEKGGVAAIAILPLIWALRLADGGRKIVEKVVGTTGQAVVQLATPEVVTSAATTPNLATAASSVTERVVAAGMTLLVAGGVTVGAATIVKHRGNHEVGDRLVVPAVVAPSPTQASVAPAEASASPQEGAVVPVGTTGAEDVTDATGATGTEPSVEPPTGVIVDPSVSPSDEPATDPTGEPSPGGSEPPPTSTDTPPPVAPAPAWTGSFGVNWSSTDACADCGGVSLVASHATGDLLTPEGVLSVGQQFEGTASDGEGDAAWGVSAQLVADLGSNGSTGSLRFVLERDGVQTAYLGTLGDVEIAGSLETGDLVYTLSGTYNSVGFGDSPIPTDGTLQVRLSVWSDGATVTAADVTLLP